MTRIYPCEEKDICTGCAACIAACPIGCIEIQPDSEGFLYPAIDADQCTNCGRCGVVCPVSTQETAIPERDGFPHVYAAWHLNESIRSSSSSGGVFTALAENILAQGGVVVGAAFDESLVVRHIMIESPEALYRLRGSKYVQSEVSPGLYHRIDTLLKYNRPVLFSGTPCQVAGLRGFLEKPFDHLYCCDLICHGVPSPFLFNCYIRSKSYGSCPPINVIFRDKTNGWSNYGMRHCYRDGKSKYVTVTKDPFLIAFLKDYALRPACYACKFKGISRLSDLTIADFWGVRKKYPQYNSKKGTSLILVNSMQGKLWLDRCNSNLFLGSADLETAKAGNPMLCGSCVRPPQRDTFYHDLAKDAFADLIRKYHLMPPNVVRVAFSTAKKWQVAVCQLGMKLLRPGRTVI